MALLRDYDEAIDELICAVKGCLRPTVQTIKMAAVPWSTESDQIKRTSVSYEYVGLCEEDWVALFPARAKWIPQRFVDGRN